MLKARVDEWWKYNEELGSWLEVKTVVGTMGGGKRCRERRLVASGGENVGDAACFVLVRFNKCPL